MTAEIAVLNKQGVALAADSAVTIGSGGGRDTKIFNSVNKLFALSKHHPIGVMVYGNAGLSGTPWETIVKVYRKELGSTEFDTVEEYAKHFLAFVGKQKSLFPPEQQEQEYLFHAYGLCVQVRDSIEAQIKDIIRDEGRVKEGQVRRVCTTSISSQLARIDSEPFLPGRTNASLEAMQRKYSDQARAAIEMVFEQLPVGVVGKRRLQRAIAGMFSRSIFPNHVSGLVIAGFGRLEHFPSLVSFDVQSFVGNRLKFTQSDQFQVDARNNAAVIPFAQREMVDLFIGGVDPRLRSAFERNLRTLFGSIPASLVDVLPIADAERAKLQKSLEKAMTSSADLFLQRFTDLSREAHILPVVNTVAVLPKEELAAMAESLVNLTSFKRRVTMDAETVGGPVDVAVISKGDGFIWISRKHYFDPALNHQYFSTYND